MNESTLPPMAYSDTPGFSFYIEPDVNVAIENEEFLDSFVRFGAWMRFSQAYEYVRMLHRASENFERLVAASGFYSAYGAVVEDVASMMLAWICWSRYPGLRLADILYLISFCRDTQAKASEAYLEDLIAKIQSGKRTRVDSVVFAESLKKLGGVKTLQMMGLNWKKTPSVKIARSESELSFWRKLPDVINNLLLFLSDTSTLHISLAYNKIKHGPQLVMTDLIKHFSSLSGNKSDLANLSSLNGSLSERGLGPETLRVLFEGSRTKRKDPTDPPVSLFLEDDTAAIEILFSRQIHALVKPIWVTGMWIRKFHFSKSWELPPKVVMEAEEFIGSVNAKIATGNVLRAVALPTPNE
jgi:hypothetical protein